jgi:hypothetical protein
VVVLGAGSPSPARIARAAGPDRRVVFVAGAGGLAPATAALARSVGDLLDPDQLPDTTAPSAVITFSDSCLGLAARLAERLGVYRPSERTLTALTDKSAQRRALADAGIDHCRWILTRTPVELQRALDDAGGEPRVVKPAYGEGSHHTYLVRTSDELPADLPIGSTRPFVVETYLAGVDRAPLGDYVSVEALVADGVVTTIGVTGKLALLPPFREAGQFWPSHLDEGEAEQVRRLATRAVEALGVERGLTHTEIKLTPAGPRVIEVNGRLGGHIDELYGRACGLDLLALEFQARESASVEMQPQPQQGVFYQYTNLSPAEGGLLTDVDGVRAVRNVPGVAAYRLFVTRGTQLPTGVRTNELDLLTGAAADQEQMLDRIDTALAQLAFAIADDAGRVRRWRASRAGLVPVEEAAP